MNMRVLHVIRGLANSSGTTHIVNPLSEAQARAGAKVRVLYVEKPPFPAVLPDPKLVSSEGFRKSLSPDNPGISIELARALPYEIANCDIVHVHAVWNFPTWWSMRCALGRNRPYVVSPQGSFDPWAMGQRRWLKWLYGRIAEYPLMQKADCLQALTAKEAQQFRDAGFTNRVEVIPNAVRSDRLTAARHPRGLAERLRLEGISKTLLFLSRVHPKKGLDILLAAFARLSVDHPNWHLVIAGGDGGTEYLEQMKVLAARLGVTRQCHFLGEVSGSAKDEILSGADAYALISRSEGLPVAALEALGAGLPAVLSSECNLPDLELFDAGWTVKPDVDSTESALRQMLSRQELAERRGLNARRLVEERYTWDRIARDTVSLYQSILI